jgi:hypothetical protein
VSFPYIINLEGLTGDDRQRVFSAMERIASIGPNIKAHTNEASIYCVKHYSVTQLASILGVDQARITDAHGYDMILWSRQ